MVRNSRDLNQDHVSGSQMVYYKMAAQNGAILVTVLFLIIWKPDKAFGFNGLEFQTGIALFYYNQSSNRIENFLVIGCAMFNVQSTSDIRMNSVIELPIWPVTGNG
jgi:nitrous oxidase accessory protein NosD